MTELEKARQEKDNVFAGFGTAVKEFDWDSVLTDEDIAKAEVGGQTHYRPLPVGEYEFVAAEVEKETSAKGNPMIKVKLVIDDDEGEVWITDRLVLTEKAMFKVVAFFRALGVDPKAGTFSEKVDRSVGQTGRVSIKHELYNGKDQNRVDRYLPKSAPSVSAPAAPKVTW